MTTANDILIAIRKKYPGTAIVPEISVSVPSYSREEGDYKPLRRIDALMFNGGERIAIEIKVSAADWRADTRGKIGPWMETCHRFIYAVPHDLPTPRDLWRITSGREGIWELGADGKLTVRRPATANKYPTPLPPDVVQRLGYRATPRIPAIRKDKVLSPYHESAAFQAESIIEGISSIHLLSKGKCKECKTVYPCKTMRMIDAEAPIIRL